MIETEFSTMLSLAKEQLHSTSAQGKKYCQCLVLKTANGAHITTLLCADTADALIDQQCAILSAPEMGETRIITKLVCMWDGESLDVTSHAFMKALCAAHEENRRAEILLSAGADAYVTKTVAAIVG